MYSPEPIRVIGGRLPAARMDGPGSWSEMAVEDEPKSLPAVIADVSDGLRSSARADGPRFSRSRSLRSSSWRAKRGVNIELFGQRRSKPNYSAGPANRTSFEALLTSTYLLGREDTRSAFRRRRGHG